MRRNYFKYNEEYEQGYKDGYESVLNEGIFDNIVKGVKNHFSDSADGKKMFPDNSKFEESKSKQQMKRDVIKAFIGIQLFMKVENGLKKDFPKNILPILYPSSFDTDEKMLKKFYAEYDKLNDSDRNIVDKKLATIGNTLYKFRKRFNTFNFPNDD